MGHICKQLKINKKLYILSVKKVNRRKQNRSQQVSQHKKVENHCCLQLPLKSSGGLRMFTGHPLFYTVKLSYKELSENEISYNKLSYSYKKNLGLIYKTSVLVKQTATF